MTPQSVAQPRAAVNDLPPRDDRDAFLAFIPQNARSLAVNLFLLAIQNGAESPRGIAVAVLRNLRERMIAQPDDQALLKLARIQSAVWSHKREALRFAAWSLAYAALTPAERQAYQQPGESRLRYLQSTPPTAGQLAVLHSLGCRQTPANQYEADQAIKSLFLQRRGGNHG